MNSYLIESSVCLIAFYTGYYLLFRNDKFFQRNRFYLLFSPLLSFIIPLIELSSSLGFTPINQQLSIFDETSILITEPVYEPAKSFISDPTFYLLLVYITVTSLLIGVFLYDVYKLVRFIKKKQHIRYKEYQLIYTNGKLPTFSFFHYIFWDNTQSLSEDESKMLLLHELTHVRGKHTWDILWIEILKIIFWFNPIIYLIKRSLQEQHEFIADQSVITTIHPESYHQLLVKHLFRKLNIHLTHGLHQIHLKKRIAMMNQVKPKKIALVKMLLLIPVISVLLFAFGPSGKGQPYFPDMNLINVNTLYLNCGNEVILDLPLLDENVKVICQIEGGELIKERKRGHLVIVPRKSKVQVEVFADGKKIKEYDFSVRRVPLPDIQVYQDEMPIDIQKGVSATNPVKLFIRVIPDRTFASYVPKDARFRVADFQLKLVRNGNTIISEKIEGNEVKLDHKLQQGDEIEIDVNKVQRLNVLDQVETINMSDSEKINIPVYE